MKTSNIKHPQDPQKVSKLLSKSSLGQLVEKAYFLLSIQEALQDCLPEDLKNQHCRVANLNGKTLVIQTEQASFATRLRYQQHDILERLNAKLNGIDIQSIETRVRLSRFTGN